MIYPPITICILTHARTKLLPIALHSALQQDYPGVFEILVLNDCPEQELRCSDPRVRIVSIPHVRSGVSGKRNIALEIIRTPWIAWLDDDDMILPNHLQKIRFLSYSPFKCLTSAVTFFFDAASGQMAYQSCTDMLVHRSSAQLVRYPEEGPRQDWKFLRDFSLQFGQIQLPYPDITYVHCWGNGAYHVSGQGDKPARYAMFRDDARSRIASGDEPSGVIDIIPAPGAIDYAFLAKKVLSNWVEAHAQDISSS